MTNDNPKCVRCGIANADGSCLCGLLIGKPLPSEPSCEHDRNGSWIGEGMIISKYQMPDCPFCKPVEPHRYEVEFKTKDLPKLKHHIHIEPFEGDDPVEPSVEEIAKKLFLELPVIDRRCSCEECKSESIKIISEYLRNERNRK